MSLHEDDCDIGLKSYFEPEEIKQTYMKMMLADNKVIQDSGTEDYLS